ncbi:TMEM165/GDT1 family protein [Marinisporobacter balticus]|uniref:GDT1 family protein n=1 Tax=Marinisporobacter balticus TaxID=2018667 RepID=A0A4R2KVX2_9FIRM|nr:TMEM165/GDT1 family protein [Marinisporobacter balticus]TCO78661.1 putative Ca2+/H+ antiporter (TMEM165/GDT1 family) [Marinisporobacter balticus]
MLQEFIRSLFLIFMAEMGDKTQILAMAFATQFKVYEVLAGVFIGSLLNHGIAVALGAYLSNLIPMGAIQIVAGFLFIGFALWTLKIDDDEDEENKGKKFGPVLTVALAFFIGELGDKTQLAAITLSVDASFPIFILMGTVSGMVLTSGLGIFVGSKIGDKVPELIIKLVSAGIFMIFGITKLYTAMPRDYMHPVQIIIFFTLLGISTYILLKPILKARKAGELSVFKETALTLYEYKHRIKESVDEICLGEIYCGKCQGKYCIIGYTKVMLQQLSLDKENIPLEDLQDFSESLKKNFHQEQVIESLSMTISYLMEDMEKEDKERKMIHKVRETLELILFRKTFNYDGNIESYFKALKEADEKIGNQIIKGVEK